jgi:hypothetical protein
MKSTVRLAGVAVEIRKEHFLISIPSRSTCSLPLWLKRLELDANQSSLCRAGSEDILELCLHKQVTV